MVSAARVERHDIVTDIGETRNVAEAHPDVVHPLRRRFEPDAAAAVEPQNREEPDEPGDHGPPAIAGWHAGAPLTSGPGFRGAGHEEVRCGCDVVFRS